ncbi:GNAT family N-acetyltransferase [Paenibacillus terrigena]|uniref:GNAT family N-acetyltransferase n=1 Tax=Paenibacillus terrigena TaxID=369333 RepID=UPI0028D1FCEC|nr:GNAT family N-acetyltransferase [Paenibacillus terrigena]
MALRKYEDSDIEEIVTLFYETVHTINARDYSPEQLDVWASRDDQETRIAAWRSSLRRHMTYVAVMGDSIVGFADMTLEGYLDRLYVHKDAQGQGVATALVNTLESEAARLRILEINTDASVTAKSFFERRGYVVIASQIVERKGVQLVNFKMLKSLGSVKGE